MGKKESNPPPPSIDSKPPPPPAHPSSSGNSNSTQNKIDEFKKELQHLINCSSLENGSDTPDFILAEFLVDCLLAVNKMIKRRDEWYGDKRWGRISGIIGQPKEGQVGNTPE